MSNSEASAKALDDLFKSLIAKATTVFTPAAPIQQRELFADRPEQVQQVVDAINQIGRHAILFGERGVGKTSLANILADRLYVPDGLPVITPRVNCTKVDVFGSVWAQVLEQLSHAHLKKRSVGFSGRGITGKSHPTFKIPEHISPHTVKDVLHQVSKGAIVVVVLDEFDRVQDPMSRSLFADTIKALSDEPCRATVVLVGVGDTVEQLIDDHQSIERALVQVRMPRMSTDELRKIIDNGLLKLDEMSIEPAALQQLVSICQGLPHYAHVLGLDAARSALKRQSKEIGANDFEEAMASALRNTQETIRFSYYRAVQSQRRANQYPHVLLACAMTTPDEMGFFSPTDVREQLNRVTNQPNEADFTRHLGEFCHHSRGPVLHRIGVKRRYRYRFTDPLMQPYVVMRGVGERIITRLDVDRRSTIEQEKRRSPWGKEDERK